MEKFLERSYIDATEVNVKCNIQKSTYRDRLHWVIIVLLTFFFLSSIIFVYSHYNYKEVQLERTEENKMPNNSQIQNNSGQEKNPHTVQNPVSKPKPNIKKPESPGILLIREGHFPKKN